MTDLQQNLFLAFVGFVLGLLSGQIERLASRDRRKLAWSLIGTPIIAVDPALPDQILSELPSAELVNITKFELVAAPTGKKRVVDAEAILVPNKSSHVLRPDVVTEPSYGVPHELSKDALPHELRLRKLTLRPDQLVRVTVYVRSDNEPGLDVYWSAPEEGTVFERSDATRDKGLEGSVRSALINLTAALIAPAVVSGLAILAGLTLLFDRVYLEGVAGVGSILGTLLSGYFLLRAVPHLLAWVRWFSERHSDKALNLRVEGDSSAVVVGDRNQVRYGGVRPDPEKEDPVLSS